MLSHQGHCAYRVSGRRPKILRPPAKLHYVCHGRQHVISSIFKLDFVPLEQFKCYKYTFPPYNISILHNAVQKMENLLLERFLCPNFDCNPGSATAAPLNPFLPTVAFSQLSSNICCPRDCVPRHNGGTSGAPLKPVQNRCKIVGNYRRENQIVFTIF